ncbi:DUF6255 family natural product biosynthesis protein [Streptomyces sp. KLMMK]|uniref:DUF6255 family natural product biosynthesis protein n=1 Tax=Streptomyces sp. KLMMK TaxID=3109353 RepID=UPI003FA72850
MRVRRICTHRGGWAARTRGEARCSDCGTVRFTEYAALRPPGLPHATTSPRRTGFAAGRVDVQWIPLVTRRGGACAPGFSVE